MEYSTRTSDLLLERPLGMQESFTSKDVIQNYNRLLDQIKDPLVANSLKEVATEQSLHEQSLLTNNTACHSTTLSGIRDRINNLHAEEFKTLGVTQLQNPVAMETIACTIDSLFYTSPYDIGSLYLNNRIRLYLHNLRQMNDDSLNGISMVADFDKAGDMFVLKVAKNELHDDLLHELVIGLYGVNKLRRYIPNFAYVYGGFKCSPPLIDPQTKKVVSWCLNNQNAVNYVLYEYINPAVSFEDYLKTCSGIQFLNVYVQIMYALRLGLKLINFSHYDLHHKNVLLRKLINIQGPFQIAYETERGVEYIVTDLIPTIIDYGYSHIQLEDGQHLGKNGLVPFSIFSYRSNIMHDLYKLLMFCLMTSYKYENHSVITEATKIFRFFNQTEDPQSAISEQMIVRYAFPLNETTNVITINDLASYIRTTCNCDFIRETKASYPVLDCERMCYTEENILTRIGVHPNTPIVPPDNIIEFYDIAVRLQNENREREKLQMASNFDYDYAMRSHINKMHQQLDDIIELHRGLKLVNLSIMSKEELLKYETMTIVRSSYISVGAITDVTVELRFYHQIGVAVALSFDDAEAVRVMDEIVSTYNQDILPHLIEARKVIVSNHQYLNSIEQIPLIIESVQKDPRLIWYWDGRKLFDSIFKTVPVTYPSVPSTAPITITTTHPITTSYSNISTTPTSYSMIPSL